jgi:CubicO group peptidase (beta-lactamase class C family)
MTMIVDQAEAAAGIYRDLRKALPPSAADLGLMQGMPPLPEKRVTWANWIAAPYNRWGFQHVGQIRPALTVAAGPGAVQPLPASPAALEEFRFDSVSGSEQTLRDHLAGSYTDAFLVMQGGRVVYENYWNGQNPATRHIMFSVTKSVIGLVAEVLIHNGVFDETARVDRYLPELAGSAFADATIRQVLDMAVGIDYVEQYDDPESSSSHYGYASALLPAPGGTSRYASLYEYLPSLKKRGAHGGLFHYVTAVTEVLGWAMERASGKPSEVLVEEMLWSKLGMERDAYFAADPWGRAIAGAGFNATLRDMARFCRMIARNGTINGVEIVPAPVIAGIAAGGDAAAFARDPEFAAWAPGASYRSQWYVFRDPDPAIMACGIHGQYLFIDFAADLVVVKQSSMPTAETPLGADTVRLLRALARHYKTAR